MNTPTLPTHSPAAEKAPQREWLSPSAAFARLRAPAPLLDGQAKAAVTVRFGYRIGQLGFLVGEGLLSELIRQPEIYPIPNVHESIRGYVNLQGALVPIWNLHLLLGEEYPERAQESVLVLGRGDHRVGVLIDGLPQSLKQLEPVRRAPPPPDALNGYVKDPQVGAASVWFEFDYDTFFRIQTERAGLEFPA